MREIRFEEITPQNFWQCINLKVAEHQTNFVAPNVRSIAESKVYPFLVPLAVYDGNEMVGFTLSGHDPETGKYYIVRLMIDVSHQGKGYGRATTQKLVERMRRQPDCRDIYLTFVPGNEVAESLYQSVGFERTGETDEYGEIIMRHKR